MDFKSKKSIRTTLIAKRKYFNNDLYKKANSALFVNLIKLISKFPNLNEVIPNTSIVGIGLYWPIRGEPDLLTPTLPIKTIISLPKIIGSEMIFVEYNDKSIMEKVSIRAIYNKDNAKTSQKISGELSDNILINEHKQTTKSHNINSRLSTLYQPKSIIEVLPKLIIVPGLAFSIEGYRIGFGQGYYDKYLHKIAQIYKPITVGVCFNNYLLQNLPHQPHDYQMDYVITDKTIIA